MDIPIIITKYGKGLPLPARAHALDAGRDVHAAKSLWAPAFSTFQVPLGFNYRVYDSLVERDGSRFVKTLEVVTKGSGMWGIIPRAVIFDWGFQHPLGDPWGIKLVLDNMAPWPRHIRRGRKVAQIVVREVCLDDFVVANASVLAAIPPPDGRLGGRVGSTGR